LTEVCPNCGLPKELCVCETIAKESQKIIVTTVKKAFGKLNTVITGIDEKEINLKDLAKKLKSEFACGGTAKEGKIELDSDAIKERVTYHDPCNIARSGWMVKQPRQILRSFVKDFVELDEHNHIKVDKHQKTSVPGVFAAGDCTDTHGYQFITAAGSGCMALLKCSAYLQETKK